MRNIPLLVISAALVGCTTAPPSPTRAAAAQAELQRLTQGRVAGPAISCLPNTRSRQSITVDDNTIVFRNGGTVYVNRLQGGCSGLGSGFYALVTRSHGSGLCRGDIADVADTSSGAVYGSCIIGDFVPYTRAS